MAIKSSPFSGWRLSGDDAKAFSRQIKQAKANPKAQNTIRRGEKLFKDSEKTGRIILKSRTKKT